METQEGTYTPSFQRLNQHKSPGNDQRFYSPQVDDPSRPTSKESICYQQTDAVVEKLVVQVAECLTVECPLTIYYHFTKLKMEFQQQWLQGIMKNELFRTKIGKFSNLITDKEETLIPLS
ncbi:hypothetical protein AVEN_66003-1 [Araneus ventricosus]|uniref:Uncharacterized protein n=1 Tax=Araneus ventricosus TaxID=182803 RepID=A0A4Y2IFN1_ARAVE|nr:hypothetical protein AVEN_66003-1 [Araneus ventricosus]